MSKKKVDTPKSKKEYTKKLGVTPKLTVLFNHLNSPDVYNEKEIGYNITLGGTVEELEAFAKPFDDMSRAFLAAYLKDNPDEADTAKVKKVVSKVKKEPSNDKGLPKGTPFIKFSSTYKPKLFDAQGNLIAKEVTPEIWSGSVVRVAFTYDTPHISSLNSNVGIKLYLTSVQIIELKNGNTGNTASGATAEDFGFGKEDGGYVASDVSEDEGNEADDSGAEAFYSSDEVE